MIKTSDCDQIDAVLVSNAPILVFVTKFEHVQDMNLQFSFSFDKLQA